MSAANGGSDSGDEPPLRILVIDDSRISFITLQALLRSLEADEAQRRYEIEWAPDAATGLQRIDGQDIVFVDFRIGPDSGTELIAQARARGALNALVMVTESDDPRTDAAAAAAGANDYLVKGDVTRALLGRSIRYALRNARAETELAQLNATLESRVSLAVDERRRAEAALHRAEKMEAIGRMTSILAHDFRNVLTAVSANLELLRIGADEDARTRRLVDSGLRAAERGDRMVQDLLSFSRGHDGPPPVIDAVAVIANATDALRHACAAKVEVRVEIEAQRARARIDAGQLERALFNLVSNACDASRNGSAVTLRVRAENDAQSGQRAGGGRVLVVSVRDTGVGMSPELREKALEPFFTTKPDGSGTGLGLAQVDHLVRRSEGSLAIDSEPGRGTTVTMRLPLVGDADGP